MILRKEKHNDFTNIFAGKLFLACIKTDALEENKGNGNTNSLLKKLESIDSNLFEKIVLSVSASDTEIKDITIRPLPGTKIAYVTKDDYASMVYTYVELKKITRLIDVDQSEGVSLVDSNTHYKVMGDATDILSSAVRKNSYIVRNGRVESFERTEYTLLDGTVTNNLPKGLKTDLSPGDNRIVRDHSYSSPSTGTGLFPSWEADGFED